MTAVPDETPVAPAIDRKGLAALLIGTGIIAWSVVFVRFADVGPMSSAAWRLIFALPVLWVWTSHLAAKRRTEAGPSASAAPVRLTPAMFVFIALGGLAFALDVAAFHLALRATDVANASFIANIAPILVVIGGAVFYAEHPPAKIWGAFGLALFGSWIMAGLLAPTRLGAGDLFAVGAAIFYASYLLIMKRVRGAFDGPSATLWTGVVSGVALVIMALVAGETFVPRSVKGWAAVIALGVLSHAGGQGLTSVAVGRVPVGIVALVLLAWAPASTFIGWAVLGETMSLQQAIGAAVIMAALIIARPK